MRNKKMEFYRHGLDLLKRDSPPKFHPLIDKAAAGSLKNAIALKCLDCAAWEPNEVRLCELTDARCIPIGHTSQRKNTPILKPHARLSKHSRIEKGMLRCRIV